MDRLIHHGQPPQLIEKYMQLCLKKVYTLILVVRPEEATNVQAQSSLIL